MLIVADDADVRKMLTFVVQQEYACTATAVRTGQQMKTAALSHQPNLVIIHAGTESQRALAQATWLRATPGCAHLPIILTDAIDLPVHLPADPFLLVLRMMFALEPLFRAIEACLGIDGQTAREGASSH